MTMILVLDIVVVFGLIIMSKYNQLLSLPNRFKNSFAHFVVQLNRLNDLITNKD
jgi:hypothetical protein